MNTFEATRLVWVPATATQRDQVLPNFFLPHQDSKHSDLSFSSVTPPDAFAALHSFDLDFDIILNHFPSNDAFSVPNVALDQSPLINAPSVPPSLGLPPGNTMPTLFDFRTAETVSESTPNLCYRTETKKIYICTYKNCNKRFNRIHELHRHHRGIHKKILPFPCRTDGCERAKKGFPRKDKRNDHERKIHGLSMA